MDLQRGPAQTDAGKMVSLLKPWHDFDKCSLDLDRFIIGDVTQGKYTNFTGQNLAWRWLRLTADASYADPVLQKVADSVIAMKKDPKRRAFFAGLQTS